MDILERIVKDKFVEVEERRQSTSIEELKSHEGYKRTVISAKSSLLSSKPYGIISEFKRKSPSKGIINDKVDVVDVTTGYQNAGAAGISILTDTKYFGGSPEDLQRARPHIQIPILRKDFIVDAYQVYETRAMGADLMLLIAACLTKEKIIELGSLAQSIGLEVLLEIHSAQEFDDSFIECIDILGVNNRNLKTFETSIQTSIDLADQLPSDLVKISESGLRSVEDLDKIGESGFNGFLIGEQFMKNQNPPAQLKAFMSGGEVKI